MNPTINKTDETTAEIEVSVTYDEANKLRRLLLSGIPTIAIDEITILKSTNSKINDILSQRLSLSPFCYNNYPVSSLGTTLDSILTIKNDIREDRIITTKDIISDDQCKPLFNTYLVYVTSMQQVDLRATLKIGIGVFHGKWSPVTIATSNKTDRGYKIEIETLRGIDPVDVMKKGIEMYNDGHTLEKIEKKYRENFMVSD